MSITASSPPVASRVARRERSHRRIALVGVGMLIALSTSPVFGHHLIGGARSLLTGHDHLWSVCVVALHLLLAPVHGIFHALLLAGFGYAIWDRLRALRRFRMIVPALEYEMPEAGDGFFEACLDADLDPTSVRVVNRLPVPAFTAGWVRPRVFIAADLVRRLDAAELTAVLAHEAAHVARRDPLRLSLYRALGCVLFWLPAMRRLAADLADEAEIEADDRAAKGRPLALASAIWALGGGRDARALRSAVVGFQSAALLERRIRRLTGSDIMPRSHVSTRSLVAAVLTLSIVWVSGVVVTHPMPGSGVQAGSEHCQNHLSSAFSHLFCRHADEVTRNGPCPHA